MEGWGKAIFQSSNLPAPSSIPSVSMNGRAVLVRESDPLYFLPFFHSFLSPLMPANQFQVPFPHRTSPQ